MRIIELRIANYRKITAVRIRPNGALVSVTGPNDSGKTSTLSAIWSVLLGRAGTPARPIHGGAEEAVIVCDLGEYKITRTFTRVEGKDYTMTLKITEKDGTPVKRKQQEVLDGLIGAIAFDPLAFARMAPRAQFDMLKGLVPGYDFEAKAEERQQLFDDRTAVKRQAREHTAAAEQVELPPGPEPAAVDVAGKSAELARAADTNGKIEREANRRKGLLDDAQRKEDEAEQLRARAVRLDMDAKTIRDDIAKLLPLDKPVDTAALVAAIAEARDTDRIRASHSERRRHEDLAEGFEAQASDLTRRIEALDAEKVAAVTAAKMPIDGLSFGDNEILFQGVPFAQAGTATKIRTSVGIGIALNPKLRVMTFDEGEAMDSHSLELLAKLAEANDFQVWLAKVDESGTGEFVIEDGHLAEKGKP